MLVEHRVELAEGQALLVMAVLENPGVDVAERVPMTRPSSGVMPIDVSIETPPGMAQLEAAVAQVKADGVDVLARLAGELPVAPCDVAVRRAVEAIATHLVAHVHRVRDGVEVRRLGHGRVERGVEHATCGTPAPNRRARGPRSAQVRRIVERRQVDAGRDGGERRCRRAASGRSAARRHGDAMTDGVHVAVWTGRAPRRRINQRSRSRARARWSRSGRHCAPGGVFSGSEREAAPRCRSARPCPGQHPVL